MLPGKSYTPEELLTLAWRHRWLILVPFLLASIATVLVVRALPDRYRSQTLVMVVPPRVPQAYVQPTVTTGIQDRLQSIAQQVLSRTQLEQIIKTFKLYPSRRRTWIMEDVVDAMRKDIALQVVKGDAFRLQFVYSDPVIAMRVTERLASLFIQENLRNRTILADDTSSFLETQLEDARRQLQDQETKLAAYRRRHAGELPSELDSNLQVIQSARHQLETLADSINREQDRQIQLEQAIADHLASGGGATAGTGPAASSAAVQLAQARATLKAMLTRLTPAHPDVVHMQRVIKELEKKVSAERAAGPEVPVSLDPAASAHQRQLRDLRTDLETVQRDVRFKQRESARLQQTITTYERRIEAVPASESDLATLTRDYATLQDIYRGLLTKREDARIAANLERRQIGEQFRVIDPANRPQRPFSPNRPLLDVIGMLGGLGLGVGLVALHEYRDDRLREEDDVTRVLSLPVLAIIPTLVDEADVRRGRRQRVRWWMLGTTVTLLSVAAAVAWYVRWVR